MADRQVSRKEFLRHMVGSVAVVAAIGLGMPVIGDTLAALLLRTKTCKWYEVVQDMKDGNKWHVNLFAASELGDLINGKHLGHRVVDTTEFMILKQQSDYPVRLQFQDTRKELLRPKKDGRRYDSPM